MPEKKPPLTPEQKRIRRMTYDPRNYSIGDGMRHPDLQVDLLGFEDRPDVEKALRERIDRTLAGEDPPRRGRGRPRKYPLPEAPAAPTDAAPAPKPRLVTKGRNWTAPEEPPGYEGLYPKNDDDWNEFADLMQGHRMKNPRSNIGAWKRLLVKEETRWFDGFKDRHPQQWEEWKARRQDPVQQAAAAIKEAQAILDL